MDVTSGDICTLNDIFHLYMYHRNQPKVVVNQVLHVNFLGYRVADKVTWVKHSNFLYESSLLFKGGGVFAYIYCVRLKLNNSNDASFDIQIRLRCCIAGLELPKLLLGILCCGRLPNVFEEVLCRKGVTQQLIADYIYESYIDVPISYRMECMTLMKQNFALLLQQQEEDLPTDVWYFCNICKKFESYDRYDLLDYHGVIYCVICATAFNVFCALGGCRTLVPKFWYCFGCCPTGSFDLCNKCGFHTYKSINTTSCEMCEVLAVDPLQYLPLEVENRLVNKEDMYESVYENYYQ